MIIGHQKIVDFLKKSVKSERTAHAYLFYGPESVGKITVAEYFLTQILADTQFSKLSDGLARIKEDFWSFRTYPDFVLVLRERNKKTGKLNKDISIEQIRDLRRHLQMASFLNGYKIAVIQGAEYLNRAASNCLLKTLEEPAGRTLLILVAKGKDVIPSTIVSRCQLVRFSLVREEEIFKNLLERGAERAQAEILAKMSDGRPGIALSLLSSPELLENRKQTLKDFLKMFKKPVLEKFRFAKDLSTNHFDNEGLLKVLDIWLSALRDLLFLKQCSTGLVRNVFAVQELSDLAKSENINKIINLAGHIRLTKSYLKQNINSKLAMENLLLKV